MAGRMKLKTFLILATGGVGVVLLVGAAAATFFGASLLASDERDEVASAPADAARPWDALLVGKAGTDLGTDKVKDATGGTPYKANLYQDAGQSTINRAKVDYDRDEKWDEKWTYSPGEIKRQVAPADDERYTEEYVWSGGGWTRR